MEPQDLHDRGIYLLRGRRYEARHVACRAANGMGYGHLYPLDDADDIFHIDRPGFSITDYSPGCSMSSLAVAIGKYMCSESSGKLWKPYFA